MSKPYGPKPSRPAATQCPDVQALAETIRAWGLEAGFQNVAITDLDLGEHPAHLARWLERGFHGGMDYMARHAGLRGEPEQLHPGSCRVISVRLDYREADDAPLDVLADPERAYIARYALGRDYHKLMRKRLAALATRIDREISPHHYRAFVDSAPVLERAFAEKAGLGWIGKNSMLIRRDAGSLFFLGEIFTDLPLPLDPPTERGHCGRCNACIDDCPTDAIVAPHTIDARRCISYLTIEHHGAIPEDLRPLLGNRVFGCDDCQLVCPWNRFAPAGTEPDFTPRHGLQNPELVALFLWDEATWLARTEGSAIRRIGHERWLRNLAVALGNAPWQAAIEQALEQRRGHPSVLVREHVAWALEQQQRKRDDLIARA